MKLSILSTMFVILSGSIAFGEAGPDNGGANPCYLTVQPEKIDAECIKIAERVVKFTHFTYSKATIKKFQGGKQCHGGAQNNYKGKFVYEFIGSTPTQDNAYLVAEESDFPALTCANGHFFKE